MSRQILDLAAASCVVGGVFFGGVVGATALPDNSKYYLEHNGSIVISYPDRGVIVYADPKASLKGTVKSGDVLFRGVIDTKHRRIYGTAYVFKRGCAPAPYAVTGTAIESAEIFKLVGAAPVRDPKSCAVTGFSSKGGNAALQFDPVGDI